MKLLQKLLILILITALMLAGAAACQKRTGSRGVGNANNIGEYEDLSYDPFEENGKKVGGKYKKYLDLLNKALKLDNFYSECTQGVDDESIELKIWLKGSKIKTSRPYEDGYIVNIVDLDKAEYIVYNDKNQGQKSELTEDEIEDARIFALWLIDLPGSFYEEEFYTNIVDTGEDKFNGIKCAYIKADYMGEVAVFHISKEHGVLVNVEFYSEEGEKTAFITRNVFEVGKVTDQDFVVPDNVKLYEY